MAGHRFRLAFPLLAGFLLVAWGGPPGTADFVAIGLGTTARTSEAAGPWEVQHDEHAFAWGVAWGGGRWVLPAWSTLLVLDASGQRLSAMETYPYQYVDAAFLDGTWVAVGSRMTPCCSMQVARSTDTLAWSAGPSLGAGNLTAVAAAEGTWIAVGDGGAILRSTDAGASWTPMDSGTDRVLWDVATGNGGTWVAVGFGVIATSLDDGVTWSAQPVGAAVESVAFGNGRFAAAGFVEQQNGRLVLSSTDGLDWDVSLVMPWLGSGNLHDGTLAYGNGVWVLAIDSGLSWSADLDSWSLPSYFPALFHGVGFGDGRFVAAGWGIVLTSTDGAAWSSWADPVWPLRVEHGGGNYLALDGRVRRSSDGRDWQVVQDAPWLSTAVHGNGSWLGFGPQPFRSQDGSSWVEVPGAAGHLSYTSDVAYGNGTWTAVGVEAVATSRDGRTWTQEPMPDIYLPRVAYGDCTWVAIGSRFQPDQAGIWSRRGSAPWQQVLGLDAPGAYLHDVAYADGVWLATGFDGTVPVVLASADGMAWDPVDLAPSGLSPRSWIVGLARAQGEWVALASSWEWNGGSHALHSADGRNWTKSPLGTYASVWWIAGDDAPDPACPAHALDPPLRCIAHAPTVAPGEPGLLVAVGGSGSYAWSPAEGLAIGPSWTVAAFTELGQHTVYVHDRKVPSREPAPCVVHVQFPTAAPARAAAETPEPHPRPPENLGPHAILRERSCPDGSVLLDGGASWDADGLVVAWRWLFPDGTQAEGQSVRHAFSPANRGGYLLAVDDAGAVDVIEFKVRDPRAAGPPPGDHAC